MKLESGQRFKVEECSSWWNASECWREDLKVEFTRKPCACRFMGLKEDSSRCWVCDLRGASSNTIFVNHSEAPGGGERGLTLYRQNGGTKIEGLTQARVGH